MSSKKAIIGLILPLSLVAAWLMHQKGPNAEAEKKIVTAPEVSVVRLVPESVRLDVKVHGVVEPRTTVRLLSEVNGKIISVNNKWKNGGFFKKGDVLFKLERYFYENQLAKAQAQYAQAKSAYVQEQGFAQVARKEWDQRESRGLAKAKGAARELALREPQLESAHKQYLSAKADLEHAKILLDKTKFKAPFDGILRNKAADIGQFVSSGQLLGEFLAVDYAEIRVPLTESNQFLLDLPLLHQVANVPVTIVANYHKKNYEYAGRFVRTEAVLDELTKVLYAVIEVDHPYKSDLNNTGVPPLRIGSYVEVIIEGRQLEGLYKLPDFSLRNGNRVYTVDEDNVLQAHYVELLPNVNKLNLVLSGLPESGASIVVGRVGEAMAGRTVSIKQDSAE